MLRELVSILRANDPLREIGENFSSMVDLTLEMSINAGQVLFGERKKVQSNEIHARDSQVNALERTIRRQLVTHLAVPGNAADIPHSLLLMSLIKDVERLGDYAKNLSEIVEIRPAGLPAGPAFDELQQIRRGVEHSFRLLSEVFIGAKRDEAVELIRHGREIARRCDQLILEISRSDYDAGATTALVLATRYYKRIGGHVLNVLSSVVMPLDKVDYYDEEDNTPPARNGKSER